MAHSQPFIHLLLLVSLETLMGRCCLYPHALGAVASPAHPSFRGLAHNVPPSSDLATFLSHQCAESTTSPGALMPRVGGCRRQGIPDMFPVLRAPLGSGGYRTELGHRVRGSSRRSPGTGAQSSSMCQLLKAG